MFVCGSLYLDRAPSKTTTEEVRANAVSNSSKNTRVLFPKVEATACQKVIQLEVPFAAMGCCSTSSSDHCNCGTARYNREEVVPRRQPTWRSRIATIPASVYICTSFAINAWYCDDSFGYLSMFAFDACVSTPSQYDAVIGIRTMGTMLVDAIAAR